MENINNCICGCTANIKQCSVQFGQGMAGDEYWVQSSCGVKGKTFDTYELRSSVAISEAIKFWNSHFSV